MGDKMLKNQDYGMGERLRIHAIPRYLQRILAQLGCSERWES